MRPVPVLTAAQATAADAATIAAGTPSLELMERAGAAAARLILDRHADSIGSGVRIHAGGGNNGGDGWVVARHLADRGVAVSVAAAAEPATPDAKAMRDRIADRLTSSAPESPSLYVDALLGTGARGVPRGAVAEGIRALLAARAHGARVVALDVPSGLDATTGESSLVAPAHCTVTFGSVKRGQLLARHLVGTLIAVDIGLADTTGDGERAELVTPEWVRGSLPSIPHDAHKGTRGKLAIVGGAIGMAGAAILAARCALRSGAGMVRALVQGASLAAVQAAAPAALAGRWPESDDEAAEMLSWADGVLIGPGLGATDGTRLLVERILRSAPAGRPIALDADGLNVFAGEAETLGALVRGRACLLTPHPAEASRLAGIDLTDVLARRFEVAGELARRTGAGVLLKGVPTVIAGGGEGGKTMVSARGTAVLATAGSGDVLAGIAGTLLMQTGDPLRAGACAAFVHGRAAEIAGPRGAVRGVDLDDVVAALGPAWWSWPPPPEPPVLAELPSLGEDA